MARQQRRSNRRRASSRPRLSPLLALATLLIIGAIALERVGVLPEPFAAVVRQAEQWLEPLLEEVGIGPSPAPEEPTSPSGRERTDDLTAVAQALTLLNGIPVEAERPRGYDRETWPHWLDADGDCQDARQEVLAAESLEPVRWDRKGCDVVSGLWRDAYTGEVLRDPWTLDVDHMVPLAEAWRSGGRDWSRERRASYANDLGGGRTLIAVSASANRAKGDQGPEDWLPPESAYRCRYVADWTTVKAHWSLSMDERELVAVGNLLADCAGR